MKTNGLIILICLSLFAKFAFAQEIVNGGFETVDSKILPRNWAIDNKEGKYIVCVDSAIKHSGRYAAKVDGTLSHDTANAFVYNSYGATSATKIHAIEISGWVRVANDADSAMALIIQDLKGEKMIRTYLSKTGGKANEWQKLNVNFTATAAAPWYGFYYGFEISSKTIAWLDDVAIKVDGKLIQDPLSMSFEPGKENIAWLNAHISPLKSTVIIHSHTDLEPIGKLCNDAKVVGIGEPTHGTKEAFQFKLRLLEYLVTQKGFNNIALEEVIPTCDKMNVVLNSNAAAIKDSLLRLPFYKCWKTAEVDTMLRWVSGYNKAHKRKVKFIGMDMEDIRCQSSREALRAYGKQYNEAVYKQTLVLDAHINSLLASSVKDGQEAKTLELADSVKSILTGMQQLIDRAGISDKEELFKLKTYERVCGQWLNSRFYNGERDEYMAANIDFYVKNHPGDKVMVWAHDFHIANARANGAKQMGAYLKDSMGNNYVAIGFTSAEGSYTASEDYTQKKWQTYMLETAYRGTYPYILSKAKNSFYFLNLKGEDCHQQAAFWLNIPMKHLDIAYIQSGADNYKFYGNLGSVFDGIVFYKTTSASKTYLKN